MEPKVTSSSNGNRGFNIGDYIILKKEYQELHEEPDGLWPTIDYSIPAKILKIKANDLTIGFEDEEIIQKFSIARDDWSITTYQVEHYISPKQEQLMTDFKPKFKKGDKILYIPPVTEEKSGVSIKTLKGAMVKNYTIYSAKSDSYLNKEGVEMVPLWNDEQEAKYFKKVTITEEQIEPFKKLSKEQREQFYRNLLECIFSQPALYNKMAVIVHTINSSDEGV